MFIQPIVRNVFGAIFSATLRNEVDLNQLRENLLTVVEETVLLAHVSLWLRTSQPAVKQQRVSNTMPENNEEEAKI